MRPSSLSLIAAGLLLSSTVSAHDFHHPAANHRMIQVRQATNATSAAVDTVRPSSHMNRDFLELY